MLRWCGPLLVAFVATIGCEGNQPRQANINKLRGQGGSSGRASSLLDSVTATLSQLPERCVVELSQAQVIVDARKSSDGERVRASLGRRRGRADGPIDTLVAPNARFRSSGVRPGDQAKYFIIPSNEYLNEFRRGMSKFADVSPEMQQELDMGIEMGESGFRPVVLPVLEVASETELVVVPTQLAQPIEDRFELQVWRTSDERFVQIQKDLGLYANRGLPRLGWEPSPNRPALVQLVERLNQWLRQGEPQVDWQVSPLLAKLPAKFNDDPKLSQLLSDAALSRAAFSLPSSELKLIQAVAYEGQLLEETVWLRDIGRWAGRGATSAPNRAERLFSWSIDNIQLEPADEFTLPRRPWQTLLFGRGTAENRAWVFAGLCRQRGWTPLILTLPETDAEGTKVTGQRVWCGVEIAGQLLLFDPQLGLPIRTPDGSIASLADVRQAPELLRQFDLPGAPYPVTADSLAALEAGVVADSFALSKRARLLELQLAGESALRLVVDADALADRLAKNHELPSVMLWEFPFQTLLDQLNLKSSDRTRAAIEFSAFAIRPKLFKARTLHFRGREELVADADRGNIEDEFNDHNEAMSLYLDAEVRPSDEMIRRIPIRELADPATLAKINATYWAGLLSNDRGLHRSAIDWFDSVLDSDLGRELWSAGARRNSALALAAEGNPAKGAELLRKIDDGPAAAGNKLLAERLAPSGPNGDEGDAEKEVDDADVDDAETSDEIKGTGQE